ncbi:MULTISPECIES: DUF5709 domain-containing protein [Streptomyces]|uniref:DUF5709 domain-containing protein n=1 Tax=Streptomyces TaxID=1883 RepID=UPI0004C51BCC|nr:MULTISPECIES: DUF5709 domain-containing protein [Streptomyces]MCX4713998.1 DUF5709 domain-containing protein [Streptomyces griseus]QXR01045.1 hypothetical protein KV381_35140 [Streptomyces sp. WY228]
MPADARGDDVYQPQDDDGGDPPNDELDLENTLEERNLDDRLEEGYSPPERPLAVNKFGTTGAEARDGESLDQRLAQEADDVEAPDGDGIGDLTGGEGELLEGSEREPRAGRLRASADAAGRENDVFAEDVGTDGGAASAEEAAVGVTDEADIQGREA